MTIIGQRRGYFFIMKMRNFVKVDFDFYREQCNFIGAETEVFEMRRQGMSLDQIADAKFDEGYTYDDIKKISSAIHEKMKRVQEYFGIS